MDPITKYDQQCELIAEIIEKLHPMDHEHINSKLKNSAIIFLEKHENVEEVCLVHPSTDGDLVTLRITAGTSPPHVHHLQLHPRFNKDGVLVKVKALMN